MRWILLLTYGSLVAGIVFAFFRAGLQPRQPRNLPALLYFAYPIHAGGAK